MKHASEALSSLSPTVLQNDPKGHDTLKIAPMGARALIPPTPLTHEYLLGFVDRGFSLFSLFGLSKPVSPLKQAIHTLLNDNDVLSQLSIEDYLALYTLQLSLTAKVSAYVVISDLIDLLWDTKKSFNTRVTILSHLMDLPVIAAQVYYLHLDNFTRTWDVALFSAALQNREANKFYFSSGLKFYPAETSNYEHIYAYAMIDRFDNSNKSIVIRDMKRRHFKRGLIASILKKDCWDVEEKVLGGMDINATDSKGRTILQYFIEIQNNGVIDFLINIDDINLHSLDASGRTLLHCAVETNHSGLVDFLLARNFNHAIDSVVKHEPSGHMMPPLIIAIFHGYTYIAEMLLAAGADPNAHSRSLAPVTPTERPCQISALAWANTKGFSHIANLIQQHPYFQQPVAAATKKSPLSKQTQRLYVPSVEDEITLTLASTTSNNRKLTA